MKLARRNKNMGFSTDSGDTIIRIAQLEKKIRDLQSNYSDLQSDYLKLKKDCAKLMKKYKLIKSSINQQYKKINFIEMTMRDKASREE